MLQNKNIIDKTDYFYKIMSNEVVNFYKQFIGKSLNEETPSAVARWLNGILVSIEEGVIEAEFLVREEMGNPYGSLHGGMASCIIDELMGGAVFSLSNGKAYVTVNLIVDYLSSASVGEKIIGKAWVVRSGNNIANCSAELRDLNGKLLAKASSNLLVKKM
jgi:acyl-coenzyme A thioesterase 13